VRIVDAERVGLVDGDSFAALDDRGRLTAGSLPRSFDAGVFDYPDALSIEPARGIRGSRYVPGGAIDSALSAPSSAPSSGATTESGSLSPMLAAAVQAGATTSPTRQIDRLGQPKEEKKDSSKTPLLLAGALALALVVVALVK